ncbi:MAG: hypothetical protein J7J70_04445 [Deltaproteobacteria bacterium]|nr:hypothetical protein [Candidatus Tharpellaceae bacterium]
MVDNNDKLQIKPVTVIYRQLKTVLISAGLNDGDRVVLTNLNGVANGMKLRPVARENQS